MSEENENKKEESNWGGKREGSGRKEGSENQKTKDKRIVKEEMKQRVLRNVDSLMNSQMSLAEGCQMLFKIETYKYQDKDGNWKEEKKKPAIVESQKEIEDYLAGEYDDEKDVYYFITTKVPDNKAIDSMFDRVFGRARQNIGLDGGEEGKPINIINYGDTTGKIPTKKISDTN